MRKEVMAGVVERMMRRGPHESLGKYIIDELELAGEIESEFRKIVGERLILQGQFDAAEQAIKDREKAMQSRCRHWAVTCMRSVAEDPLWFQCDVCGAELDERPA